MQNRIYLCLAHMSESGMELKYIKEAFDTKWVVPLGPNVDGFEEDLKGYFPSKEIVALASGTAAVHLSLLAAGVGEGDEVLVQSFTFCASTNPIKYVGATPVMIDSESDTWNMDPELLEAAILDRIAKTGKKPKAIMTVYLYGMPAKIDEIMAIAKKYDITVIEDAAEAFGSRYKGQLVGSFGNLGILSFNGNKMIYNYRMSNICAGIGRGQMYVFEDHLAHHRHVAELYEAAFKDFPGITYHKEIEGIASNYWLSTILLDENLKVKGEDKAYATPVNGAVGGVPAVVHRADSLHTDCEPNRNVEALRMVLDEAGIEVRPLWKPMHKQPVYQDAPAYVNGVSESLFKRGLCLPSGPMVSDEDVERIVRVIKEASV